MQIIPGTHISDRIEIIREIGAGGFATVFEGRNTKTKSRCAVKVLHHHLTHDEELLDRFKKEAEVRGRLQGPAYNHVVDVTDVGKYANNFYIVMEFLEGVTLYDYVARNGPMPWNDVLLLAHQLAVVLDDVHKLDITHRDLTPRNLFLITTAIGDLLKVLDFGMAKYKSASTPRTSKLGGTDEYMAPEQWMRGDLICNQTDIWAFGLNIYFACIGRHFDERPGFIIRRTPQTSMELVESVLGALSSAQAASLPRGFKGWLEKCLRRDPEARYSTAREAFTMLRVLPHPSSGEVFSLRRPWSPPKDPDGPEETTPEQVYRESLNQAADIAFAPTVAAPPESASSASNDSARDSAAVDAEALKPEIEAAAAPAKPLRRGGAIERASEAPAPRARPASDVLIVSDPLTPPPSPAPPVPASSLPSARPSKGARVKVGPAKAINADVSRPTPGELTVADASSKGSPARKRTGSEWATLAAIPAGIIAAFVVGRAAIPSASRLAALGTKLPRIDVIALKQSMAIDEVERTNPFKRIDDRDISLQTHEVSVREMGLLESAFAGAEAKDAASAQGDAEMPVSAISFARAEAFCKILNGHLPTAEEWLAALDKPGLQAKAAEGWTAEQWAPSVFSKKAEDNQLRTVSDPSLDSSPSGHIGLLGNLREMIQDLPQGQCPSMSNGYKCHWWLGGLYSDGDRQLSSLITPTSFGYKNEGSTGHVDRGFRCARPWK